MEKYCAWLFMGNLYYDRKVLYYVVRAFVEIWSVWLPSLNLTLLFKVAGEARTICYLLSSHQTIESIDVFFSKGSKERKIKLHFMNCYGVFEVLIKKILFLWFCFDEIFKINLWDLFIDRGGNIIYDFLKLLEQRDLSRSLLLIVFVKQGCRRKSFFKV